MPLTKLSTSFFRTASPLTLKVNTAIDDYNRGATPLKLDVIQAHIDSVPRQQWLSQAGEILRLEMAMNQERRNFAASGEGAAAPEILGKRAEVNLTPTVWLEKLYVDAPSLEGVQTDGAGKQGAQGNTHKLVLPSGKRLFAKTARGKDKGSAETEVQREYDVYKKLHAAGEHPNLVKVWGWADMKLGVQHEVGFIMDHIEGPDGRTVQAKLKEAWDLGIISSAQYWSSIQYIGRCHISVIEHLRSAGWAHNDIKPENYVVDSNTGEVVVIDLGGAGLLGEKWNAVTAEYLAPEMQGPGGKPSPAAKGTAASDIFSLGASIAHAAEAASAFHSVAKPNRGLAASATPSRVIRKPVEGVGAGRYKNPFEYGVETDYTRQLKRMMNSNPLEREKTLDEHSSNKFFYDSILTDTQARDVLKGIASGSSRRDWEQKWRAAGKAPPTSITVDRLSLETKLKDKMRPYRGVNNYGGVAIPDSLTETQAALKKSEINLKRRELEEIAKLISQANAFGIDTREYRRVISDRLRQCDVADRAIADAAPPPPR